MNAKPENTRTRSRASFLIGMMGSTVLVLSLWYAIGKPGLPVPPPDYRNLVLENAQGESVTLSHFQGRPVMLHFFTTWCDQCEVMAPDLATTSKAMSNEVQIVGVSLDLLPDFQLGDAKFDSESRATEVEQFLKKHNVDYPVLFDRSGKCANALLGHQVPVQVVFGSSTKLLRRFTGVRSREGLRAILKACVEEDREQARLSQ